MRRLSDGIKRLRPRSQTFFQVRVYDRQDDFARDIERLRQHGWRLQSSERRRASIPMELTRASARGLAPQVSSNRTVARFVCRSTPLPETATFTHRRLVQHHVHLRQGVGERIVRFGELVAGRPNRTEARHACTDTTCT